MLSKDQLAALAPPSPNGGSDQARIDSILRSIPGTFEEPTAKVRKPLRVLNLEQRTIVAMFAQGMRPIEISTLLEISVVKVNYILRDPLADEEVKRHRRLLEREFELLYAEMVDCVRRNLRSKDEMVQLKAADIYLKVFGHYKQAEVVNNTSAEDVARQILVQHNTYVQVSGPMGPAEPRYAIEGAAADGSGS